MSFLLNYQQKHEKLSPAWWGCSQKSAQKGKGKKKKRDAGRRERD